MDCDRLRVDNSRGGSVVSGRAYGALQGDLKPARSAGQTVELRSTSQAEACATRNSLRRDSGVAAVAISR